MNSGKTSAPVSQLPLPLASPAALSRADLIVSAANAHAIACIDAWPDWHVPALALFGPSGCGKTHLAASWCQAAGGTLLTTSRLASSGLTASGAVAIEDVDSVMPTAARDRVLFEAIESATPASPRLLTGRLRPSEWQTVLPDLRSRFDSLPALALWAPDDALLEALARKLFEDRQLSVTDSVIRQILHRLERSPAAIRDFVAALDAKALAEAGPVTLSLVRRCLAARDGAAQ